jgi:hypothetical protein
MMNARHRIATVCVLRRRRRQWRCLRRGDCIRRRRWRRSRRARHDRSRCGRGHGVLPQSARQKNVDYMVVRTKKKASFSNQKTRKKSSSTATSLWTLSVRGSQMAFKKRLLLGGQKRSKIKERCKRRQNPCVFRESSSVGFTFFYCRTFFSILQSVSCHLFFSYVQ